MTEQLILKVVLCSLILLGLFLNLLCLVLGLFLCYFALLFLLLLAVWVLLCWFYPQVLSHGLTLSCGLLSFAVLILGTDPLLPALATQRWSPQISQGFLLTWPCKGVILLTALFPSIVLHFVFSLSPCSLLVFPVQVCCGDIWPLVLALSEGLWYLVCYCLDISWPNSWLQGDLEVCLWTELRAGRIAVVTVCHIGVLRRSCHTCRNEKPHISLTEFPKAVQQSFKLNSHR